MATIQQIAERLDLSPATVSRCLNNHPDMSGATRSAVLQAAAELGYIRRSARGRPRTKPETEISTIAAVIHHATRDDWTRHVVVGQMLAGISAEAEAMGVRVMLRHAASADPDEPIDPGRFVDKDQIGAILIGRFGAIDSQSVAARFPCVTIAHQDESGKIDCVDQDNLQATSLLIRHLRASGHQKIAFIGSGSPRHSYRERLAGYVAELALEGRVDPNLILNVQPRSQDLALSTEAIAVEVARLVREGVTAAICVHDNLAYQLAGALTKLHDIAVPRDLSLVGFDSLPTPAGMPVLTSISSPFEQMGALSVRRLLQRIRVPETPAIRVVFSCALRNGASVAVLPGVSGPSAVAPAEAIS